MMNNLDKQFESKLNKYPADFQGDKVVLIFLEGWPQDYHWGLYASGFRWSADRLIEGTEEKGALLSMVYAIMFLYRHYLELKFKEILVIFHDCLGLGEDVKQYTKTHDLSLLWEDARTLLAEHSCFSKDLNSNNEYIEWLVQRYQVIDKSSFSFRYPFEKDGISNSMRNLPKSDCECHTYIDLEEEQNLVGFAADYLEDVTERLVNHCESEEHILEYEKHDDLEFSEELEHNE